MELFLLKGLRPAVASQQFHGVSLTSLRGRDNQVSSLQRALLDVEAGNGRVVGVIGATGTGKSRLCYEFAEWCRARLIPVFEARVQPYGVATPLQLVIEFLRSSYFRIAVDAEPLSAGRKVAECLAEIGATAPTDLSLVCHFLGIPFSERSSSWLNPQARNARLLDIVRHMVRDHGTQTSIIIIDDLHWLDEASEEFVATLADAIAMARTMLVINSRPGYFAQWMRFSHHRQIELAELNSSDTEILVHELVGLEPKLEEIRQHIATRSPA